jgi:uncharacterized membrane protein
MVLAFVAVGFLVFFIHHLAASIQASSILRRLTAGTHAAIEDLFPEDLGAAADEPADAGAAASGAWTPGMAEESGYIVTIDSEGLMALAREEGRVMRMALAVGDFAVRGQPLAWLEGGRAVGEETRSALNRCYSFDAQRTIEQDAPFGLQEIVDVGLKALSPGINDQSTAILCIDRLSELLVHLARRRIETPLRRDAERLRVIARGATFADLLVLAFRDLCEAGAGKPAILGRLLDALQRVGAATSNAGRRRALSAEVERVAECATRTVQPVGERDALLVEAGKVRRALTSPEPRATPREAEQARS